MAFEIRNFDKLSLTVTGGAPIQYTYGSTVDDITTISASGYFNTESIPLNIGDVILVNATDDTTFLSVTATSPNVTTTPVFTLNGGLTFKGTWNADTNTPTLTSGVGTQGDVFIVSVDGNTNLDGITDWKVNDWAAFDGTAWVKLDHSDVVESVNGKTGNVVLSPADLQVIETFSATSPIAAATTYAGITGGTAKTLTINSAPVAIPGSQLTIKDQAGTAGANTITIATAGSETIDGAATLPITVNFGVMRLYSQGGNWFTL